jgi:hypothetical protein
MPIPTAACSARCSARSPVPRRRPPRARRKDIRDGGRICGSPLATS